MSCLSLMWPQKGIKGNAYFKRGMHCSIKSVPSSFKSSFWSCVGAITLTDRQPGENVALETHHSQALPEKQQWYNRACVMGGLSSLLVLLAWSPAHTQKNTQTSAYTSIPGSWGITWGEQCHSWSWNIPHLLCFSLSVFFSIIASFPSPFSIWPFSLTFPFNFPPAIPLLSAFFLYDSILQL